MLHTKLLSFIFFYFATILFTYGQNSTQDLIKQFNKIEKIKNPESRIIELRKGSEFEPTDLYDVKTYFSYIQENIALQISTK